MAVVLVVEDDSDLLGVLAEALAEAGFLSGNFGRDLKDTVSFFASEALLKNC